MKIAGKRLLKLAVIGVLVVGAMLAAWTALLFLGVIPLALGMVVLLLWAVSRLSGHGGVEIEISTEKE